MRERKSALKQLDGTPKMVTHLDLVPWLRVAVSVPYDILRDEVDVSFSLCYTSQHHHDE